MCSVEPWFRKLEENQKPLTIGKKLRIPVFIPIQPEFIDKTSFGSFCLANSNTLTPFVLLVIFKNIPILHSFIHQIFTGHPVGARHQGQSVDRRPGRCPTHATCNKCRGALV
jgi:hypothetical protein